jgi:acyl-CoA reductase-like NAD-dependent aldehyde dehydrogenase
VKMSEYGIEGPLGSLIGGGWHETSSTGRFLDATAPSTQKKLAALPYAGGDEVEAAVAAARLALPAWRHAGIEARSRVLVSLADLLTGEYGEQGTLTPLKNLISSEVGKRLPEADIEVIETADMIRWFAEAGSSVLANRDVTLNSELWPTKRSEVRFEPVGVVAVIKPWNYPLELPMWAIAPALLAGNTIVFKPSEHSSLVGIRIAQLLVEAGAPSGVVNVVFGADDVGRALVAHPGIDMVAFTGGVASGREVARKCGEDLKRCSLELGGNDAAIVVADADLDLTSRGLVWGAFCNSGQVCVGVKRVFAEAAVVDDLLGRVEALTAGLRRDIDYGPLISEAQALRVVEFIDDAERRGAKVVVDGRVNRSNLYLGPTVLVDVPAEALLMTDECFGPVLPIVRVATAAEAIERANETPYGLGASVWTSDLARGEDLAGELQAGMVWINDVNVAFAEAPWGGVKQSGLGVELSEFGIYEFVETKHVSTEQSRDTRRDWWYPYEARDEDAR